MKQFGFGRASCIISVGTLVVVGVAWMVIRGLPQPRNHDLGAAFQNMAIAMAFVAAVALFNAVGLVLGIVGLCQSGWSRITSGMGVVLNGLGLLAMILLAIVLLVVIAG